MSGGSPSSKLSVSIRIPRKVKQIEGHSDLFGAIGTLSTVNTLRTIDKKVLIPAVNRVLPAAESHPSITDVGFHDVEVPKRSHPLLQKIFGCQSEATWEGPVYYPPFCEIPKR